MTMASLNRRWTRGRVWIALGGAALCGLMAGITVAALYSPVFKSTALVIVTAPKPLPAVGLYPMANGIDSYITAQEAVVKSPAVLTGALPNVHPVMLLEQLRHDITVGNPTNNVISITAEGRSASDADSTVMAVERSYASYIGSPSGLTGQATLLQLTPTPNGTWPIEPVLIAGLIGVPVGGLIGIVLPIAMKRRRTINPSF